MDEHQLAQAIANSIQTANDALYFSDTHPSESRNSLPTHLSTLSGLLLTHSHAHLFHTGDSRIYRYRQAQQALTVLSKDHRHHKGTDKGALSAALGADALVDLHYDLLPLQAQDVYLIMTDGVYEYVDEEEMAVFIRPLFDIESTNLPLAQGHSTTPTRAADNSSVISPITSHIHQLAHKLCQAALENGSTDNLSCVAVYVHSAAQTAFNNTAFDLQSPDLQSNANTRTNLTQTTRQLRLPEALSVGDHIDDFCITQVLHHTARSSVYLAEDQQKNLRILKVPSAYFEDDATYLRQFLKEEKIGLSFNHDSLLKFYPKPLSSPYLYHVTEYVAGSSLRQFLDSHILSSSAVDTSKPNQPAANVSSKSSPPQSSASQFSVSQSSISQAAPTLLDIKQTHALVKKIALALRVMHRNYYLHQDVKPENILLTASGDIKLIDFGSVGSLILKDALSPPMGDLHYTAPEYYTHAPKGIYSDLFSLGVITYEMLTGQLPFEVKALASAHKSGETLSFTPAKTLNPSLPYWLDEVLIRALHPDIQARYQSLGEFLSDLDPSQHEAQDRQRPLIEQNPLLVWQGISVGLFCLCLFLLTVLLWNL